jgi:hypothetical protein
MHCPRCNSLNPDDAKFCSLCLTRFDVTSPSEQPLSPEQNDVSEDPALHVGLVPRLQPEGSPETQEAWERVAIQPREKGAEATSGPVRKRGDVVTWICPSCENENPMSMNLCSVCGTSFFDAFKPPEPERTAPPKDARIAGVLSIIPGLGHLYLGDKIDGFARVVLGAWWLLTAIFLPAPRAVLFAIKMAYLLAYLGLAGVSVFDAARKAESPTSVPLIPTRLLLYVALALGGILVVGGLAASFAVRS